MFDHDEGVPQDGDSWLTVVCLMDYHFLELEHGRLFHIVFFAGPREVVIFDNPHAMPFYRNTSGWILLMDFHLFWIMQCHAVPFYGSNKHSLDRGWNFL